MAKFRFEAQRSEQEIYDLEFEKLYTELQENDRHKRENERQAIFEITQKVSTKLDIECSRIEKQLKYYLSKIASVEAALKTLRHEIIAMQQELVQKQSQLKIVSAKKQALESEHQTQLTELKKQQFDLEFLAADLFNPDRPQFQFQAKRIAKQIQMKTESFQKDFTILSKEFQELTNDVESLPGKITRAIDKAKEMQSHIQESKQTIIRQKELLLVKQQQIHDSKTD